MNQLEIQFFWPLTEQIPLDLDYTNCDTRTQRITRDFVYYNGSTNLTQPVWGQAVLNLSETNVKVQLKEKPPWYRSMLLNLLGIKWEKI